MGDMEGNSVLDAVTSDGANASITASDGRTVVSVMAAASGGPTAVTVEVSPDGSNWYERTAVFGSDVTDGSSEAESFTTGAAHARARGDANVARVEIAAKGV